MLRTKEGKFRGLLRYLGFGDPLVQPVGPNPNADYYYGQAQVTYRGLVDYYLNVQDRFEYSAGARATESCTTSVMHSGMDLKKRHFVVQLEALRDITATDKKDWSIELRV
jgi:hypothetical protein